MGGRKTTVTPGNHEQTYQNDDVLSQMLPEGFSIKPQSQHRSMRDSKIENHNAIESLAKLKQAIEENDEAKSLEIIFNSSEDNAKELYTGLKETENQSTNELYKTCLKKLEHKNNGKEDLVPKGTKFSGQFPWRGQGKFKNWWKPDDAKFVVSRYNTKHNKRLKIEELSQGYFYPNKGNNKKEALRYNFFIKAADHKLDNDDFPKNKQEKAKLLEMRRKVEDKKIADLENNDSYNPLMYAAANGNDHNVRKLLEHGANPCSSSLIKRKKDNKIEELHASAIGLAETRMWHNTTKIITDHAAKRGGEKARKDLKILREQIANLRTNNPHIATQNPAEVTRASHSQREYRVEPDTSLTRSAKYLDKKYEETLRNISIAEKNAKKSKPIESAIETFRTQKQKYETYKTKNNQKNQAQHNHHIDLYFDREIGRKVRIAAAFGRINYLESLQKEYQTEECQKQGYNPARFFKIIAAEGQANDTAFSLALFNNNHDVIKFILKYITFLDDQALLKMKSDLRIASEYDITIQHETRNIIDQEVKARSKGNLKAFIQDVLAEKLIAAADKQDHRILEQMLRSGVENYQRDHTPEDIQNALDLAFKKTCDNNDIEGAKIIIDEVYERSKHARSYEVKTRDLIEISRVIDKLRIDEKKLEIRKYLIKRLNEISVTNNNTSISNQTQLKPKDNETIAECFYKNHRVILYHNHLSSKRSEEIDAYTKLEEIGTTYGKVFLDPNSDVRKGKYSWKHQVNVSANNQHRMFEYKHIKDNKNDQDSYFLMRLAVNDNNNAYKPAIIAKIYKNGKVIKYPVANKLNHPLLFKSEGDSVKSGTIIRQNTYNDFLKYLNNYADETRITAEFGKRIYKEVRAKALQNNQTPLKNGKYRGSVKVNPNSNEVIEYEIGADGVLYMPIWSYGFYSKIKVTNFSTFQLLYRASLHELQETEENKWLIQEKREFTIGRNLDLLRFTPSPKHNEIDEGKRFMVAKKEFGNHQKLFANNQQEITNKICDIVVKSAQSAGLDKNLVSLAMSLVENGFDLDPQTGGINLSITDQNRIRAKKTLEEIIAEEKSAIKDVAFNGIISELSPYINGELFSEEFKKIDTFLKIFKVRTRDAGIFNDKGGKIDISNWKTDRKWPNSLEGASFDNLFYDIYQEIDAIDKNAYIPEKKVETKIGKNTRFDHGISNTGRFY